MFAINKSRISPMQLMVLATLAIVGVAAQAGTTGAEFQSFYNLMNNWTSGFLGKGIAIAAFLIGAGMGVAKQTILPAVLGILFAIVFTVGPNVINGMMTAVI